MSEKAVILCDLDGVVWLSGIALPGAPEAIAALRADGHRVLFVTNNSAPLVADHEQRLAAIGVPATGDVLTSSQAAAGLIAVGTKVFVCGGAGIVEAVASRGATVVAVGEQADAVVVGITPRFDYELLSAASAALRAGARLIATNDDATYPTPNGPIPGAGSLLAAVVTASGATPTICGKPYEPMAELVRAVVGDHAAATAVVVGDRPDTDGVFARTLGCRFALVETGVTSAGAHVDPVPDLRAVDLAGVAGLLRSAP